MVNIPPSGNKFAIPNCNNTTNTLLVNGEPGTWQCVATGQPFNYMNGTYTITGSHFFTGGVIPYAPYNCFGRNGLPLLSGDGINYYGPCWESRSASNNYNGAGVYQGTTSTVVSGSPVLGEYVSITSPYGIILQSYSLSSSNYNGVSTPASGWVIAGSNDGGITYTTVHVVTNNPLPVAGYGIFNVSNTISYTTYIIIITNITNGIGAANIGTWNIYSMSDLVCFKEDTKILTDKGYIPIQNLRKGDLVKTLKNDYKAIDVIGFREIHHIMSNERIKDQLYKCSQINFPEVFEDLIITGSHCILVDSFKDDIQKGQTIEINGKIYVTDRKYRLPACVSEKTSIYEIPGVYTVYHIALENHNDYMNYGIYANGLVVETCPKRYLKELSNMTFI
jgi:hypothetical protein